MNKVHANVVQAQRKAWANHLKKVTHNPESYGFSRADIQRDSVSGTEAQPSRWERRFQQDS